MCLSCYTSVKTPENIKLSKELNHTGAPWHIDVTTPGEFRQIYAPNPDLIEQFGKFGVINHVFLHNSLDNNVLQLNLNDCELIAKNSSALICTCVDNSIDIWAIQWKNGYLPKLTEKIVNRTDFNFKL